MMAYCLDICVAAGDKCRTIGCPLYAWSPKRDRKLAADDGWLTHGPQAPSDADEGAPAELSDEEDKHERDRERRLRAAGPDPLPPPAEDPDSLPPPAEDEGAEIDFGAEDGFEVETDNSAADDEIIW
jgi:hypothetical protein